MPIPPNWFAIAAFGLLGAFLNPGFWLVGAGLEIAYLWLLARNPRFRAVVDAARRSSARVGDDEAWRTRYEAMVGVLDDEDRERQAAIELEADEVSGLLRRSGAIDAQVAGVRKLAWLHLQLLVARAAFATVLADAARQADELDDEQRRIEARLSDHPDDELARSLRQRLGVIDSRRTAHGEARRRRELVEAELARVRQQMSLLREQALLATDESSVAQSLDALTASLDEAQRWFADQRDLIGDLDPLGDRSPPEALMRPASRRRRRAVGET